MVWPFKRMQVDLFANMKIDGITLEGYLSKVSFTREADAPFVDFPKELGAWSRHTLCVSYSGKPIAAKRSSWNASMSMRRR
jgi:hypothetical protein